MKRCWAVISLAGLLLGSCGPSGKSLSDSSASSENEQVKNRGEGKDHWWDALPRPAWNAFETIEQSQEWFEVYAIRPGIFAIYEPGQFEEVISYLIVGTDQSLLFDTGLGIGNMRALVAELTDRDPIVLNSHTHYDHIGGNHHFSTIYGTDTDYTRSHEHGIPHGEVKEFVSAGWIWKPLPQGFSRESYRIQPFEVTQRVSERETIELGGRTLEILFTPGHAPDALCLLDRANRLLFTGDTFYPATLYAHLPGSDFETYARTAQRLAELRGEVDWLLPAHNEPWVESRYLKELPPAFQAARDGTARSVVTDDHREYLFDGFSILVTEPPPWTEES